MLRYTLQLFGLTIFAIAVLWQVSPGDARQAEAADSNVLWADTIRIDVSEPSQQQPAQRTADQFFKNVRKLHEAALKIRDNYMEEIDPADLVEAGIKGMLSDLDRFSVVMPQESYQQLMEATSGKYSGLGMQIDSRDNFIRIIAPIEGTPAQRKGLRAGDKIIRIDTISTEGMTSSEASKLMRGPAGTSINLTIRREGIKKPIDFEVERAVIELKSVNYSGVVPGTDIGYVRLSRFAEETSHELREAINELNHQDSVSALIFDLRSNGGGLLDQANEVADLFLDSGRTIVYTQGKDPGSEEFFRSKQPALFPEKPLVILVDGGTASASEIVAGAVQDWDRGIIMGQTTYGKGLVQKIFPITNDGSIRLKLTTAKYYVPSGRCIQREDRQSKDVSLEAELSEVDSISIEDREIFRTNNGRVVYGGGGIVPDLRLDPESWKVIEINLERQSMFFDFAVRHVADNPQLDPTRFEVTDEIIDDFRAFLSEREFSYKSALEIAMEDMAATIDEENKRDLFQPALDKLETVIAKEKDADFLASMDYIKRAIKREVVTAVAGQAGMYEQLILKQDKAVLEAVELLTTDGRYSTAISEGASPEKAEL